MITKAACRRRERDDRGASLLLALAFVLAIGLVISAIATITAGAFTTTYNLGQERTLEANAESAATIAIENVRYTGSDPTTSTNCMPTLNPIFPTATGSQGRMTVFCSSSGGKPPSPSATSRDVIFTACEVSSGATLPPPSLASCGTTALLAEIVFDDLPPNAPSSAINCGPGATPPLTCGLAMTVDTWDVRFADS